MKRLVILVAVLCLALSGCDGVKDEDRREVDEIGSKSEIEQQKLADDLTGRAKKEMEDWNKLSEKEKEANSLPENAHQNRLLFLFAEVREDGVVSKKAIKRVRPALPFFKRLANAVDQHHALDARIKLVEESKEEP